MNRAWETPVVAPDFKVSVIDTSSGPRFAVDVSRTFLSFRQPSAETVRVRMSMRTERSMESGMIQNSPGPRNPVKRPRRNTTPRSYSCAIRRPESTRNINAPKTGIMGGIGGCYYFARLAVMSI